jgi:hypothetical protein
MLVQATTQAVRNPDLWRLVLAPEIPDLDPAHVLNYRICHIASSGQIVPRSRARQEGLKGGGRENGKGPQAEAWWFYDCSRNSPEMSTGSPNLKEPRPTEVEAGSDERRRCRRVHEKTSTTHVRAADEVAVGAEARGTQMAPCWPASPWRRAKVSQTDSPPGY